MDSKEFWQQVFLAHIKQQIQTHTAVSYSDDAMKAYEDRFALVAEKPSQPAAEEQPLPCPVCGGKPEVRGTNNGCDVCCLHIGTKSDNNIAGVVTVGYATRAEAIRRWNTRA